MVEIERLARDLADIEMTAMRGIERTRPAGRCAFPSPIGPGDLIQLKDVPSRPGHHGRVWPLPRTTYLKVVSCSAPTGPARMHLAGADADLGTHAEFSAIGELG
jgi:hypothetical protein